MVGLAGPPGAGKSTLAKEVVRRVNRLWPEKASSFDAEVNPPDVAIVLPMDGFHLYRSQLDAMEVELYFILKSYISLSLSIALCFLKQTFVFSSLGSQRSPCEKRR